MDSAVATLLDYPDVGLDRAALAAEAPPELADFAGWWAQTPLVELQERYVADLDLRGGTALYLTYQRFGDERARGRALVALKRLLREAGWELGGRELPDYLPVLLELAAADPDVGLPVLAEYRPELVRIAASLARGDSPWAAVVEAVLAEVAPPEAVPA